jgi:hypothetical protein
MSEDNFKAEVEQTVQLYEKLTHYAAIRTRQMIAELGEVEALSRLMVSADLQKGFKVLRDNGRLAKTFEALVVRFGHLFKTEVVEAAQWRLDHAQDLQRG